MSLLVVLSVPSLLGVVVILAVQWISEHSTKTNL
jgi:hypothetical protein